MNTPNKLTLIRVLMVPIFLFVLLLEMVFPDWATGTRAIAGLIFIAASVTDMIDGRMARKYNLVTNFGKFLDPLADKLLVAAALVGLTGLGMMHFGVWITVIILAREFLVTSLRLVANTGDGTVIAASPAGKLKTIFQMVAISVFLLQDAVGALLGVEMHVFGVTLGDVLMWIAVVLTIWSGWQYLHTYKRYIDYRN